MPVIAVPNPGPASGDRFGNSVGISGTRLLVGAMNDDTGATNAGSAYVFDLTSAAPASPTTTISNPDPAATDFFGWAVAISGTNVVVGAPFEDTGADSAGRAFVYDLSSTTPSIPRHFLNNPNASPGDFFATSVAISGNRVVIGSYREDFGAADSGSAFVYDISSGTPTVPTLRIDNPSPGFSEYFGWSVGVSGSRVVVAAYQDDTGATDSGVAYVFELSSGTPNLPILTAVNPSAGVGDNFGYAVAISGTKFVAGVPFDDTGALNAGSAYVFDLSSGTPGLPVASLSQVGPLPGDQFGYSIAISGGILVVGAPYDDTTGTDSGSVYVFNLNGASPTLPFLTLSNPSPAADDRFGWSVAISGNRIVVGAVADDTGTSDAGSAYVFDLTRANPSIPVFTFNNPGNAASDWYGYSVAISGNRVAVGAFLNDFVWDDSGSVYVYDLNLANPVANVLAIHNPAPGIVDLFGSAIAMSGTRLVVGAYSDNAGAANSGSVYVFDLSKPSPATPTHTITNPTPQAEDYFGARVAIAGTRIVAGAPGDDSGGLDSGSAYVFDIGNPSPAVLVATLNNPSPSVSDSFGNDVAISDTHVIVGVGHKDAGASAPDVGAAYVYYLNRPNPAVPVATLANPTAASGDQFAFSLATEDKTIAVGAPFDDARALDKGFAYVFSRSDLTTLTPLLAAPASNEAANSATNVSFNLPEAAMPGSVKLSFGATQLTLAASQHTAGAHAFTFNPANPTASVEVASGAAVVDGTYTVTLSYQDALGNAAASAASANVTVDTQTFLPTLISPASNDVTPATVGVSFSLPETALPGSVTLTFAGDLLTRVLTLAASQETAGAHAFSFDVGAPAAAAEVESGLPIVDGVYSVTLSYRDALGNPAATAVAANVTLDTQPPVVGGDFAPSLIVEGALPDYRGQATGDAVSYTQSPAPGTLVPAGTVTVYVYGTDAAGNVGQIYFYVRVVPAAPIRTVLGSKGAAVPGAGVSGSGIPAGAVWATFGVPSINDAGQAAVLATYKVGAVPTTAILGWALADPEDMVVIAKKGDAAPGIAGAVLSGLKDPVLGVDGAVAWMATLANAPGTTGAVTTANNAAIFLDPDGALPMAAVVIAQKGAAVAGAAIWKSFGSVALGANAVAFTGMLETRTAGVSPGPGGATTLSDSGLWVYTRATSTLAFALREGDAMLGSTIKTIHALVARPGSAGQGRGVENDGGQDYTQVRVTLADNRQALANVAQDGVVTTSYIAGGDAPDYGTGAKWQSFGLPTQNSVSAAAAFLGTVKAKTGTATTANNVAIFAEDDHHIAGKIVAKGDAAPGTVGTFAAFKDPVSASGRSVAFLGTMKTDAVATITTANNDGLLRYQPATGLTFIAREGAQPPEAPLGAQWKAFTSLALPEGRGPIFAASMASKIGTTSPGPGGVTTANDVGLWATDSFGALRLLMREGDAIGASTVKTFTVLSSVVGSPAQTRSYNNTGGVIVRVTDATGAQHLVHIAVP